ncbi:Nucleolar MIF4G domain-containing protein 1, partial [Perkinsus olseni]
MDELEKDGLDADLFTALDGIEDAVKDRKKELKGKPEPRKEDQTCEEQRHEETTTEPKKTGAYVPPHLRAKKSTTAEEERAQKLSKIRGLVNKLSEGNIELITAEIVALLGDDDQSIVDGYAREFVG